MANADPRKTKMLAERQARRGTLDVSCLSDTDMHMMSQQNTLDPLDTARLDRAGNVLWIVPSRDKRPLKYGGGGAPT